MPETTYARYWDLPQKERAELTDEEFDQFKLVELMEHGAVNPTPPVPEPVPEVDWPGEEVWSVRFGDHYYNKDRFNCIFANEEDAGKFLALKPRILKEEYLAGTHYKAAQEPDDIALEKITVRTQENAGKYKDALSNRENVVNRNKKAKDEYEEAVKNCNKILTEFYRDRCLRLKRVMAEIKAVWDSYCELAGGNQETAMKFLKQRYDVERIYEAMKWHGEEWPVGWEPPKHDEPEE